MSYHVPVSSIPLLQDPPFVLGLVWLGTALGYRVLVWLRAPLAAVSRLERGVLCAAIGLGLLQYLPFTLGMAGLLTPTAVWSGLALLTALLAKDLWRVAAGIARVASRRSQVASEETRVESRESRVERGGAGDAALSPQPSALSHDSRPDAHRLPPNAWLYACAAVLAVPLAIAFLQALCPVTDHDGLCYHLNAPKRWLQGGRIDYLPSLVQTNRPMGVEMLFTLALAVWSDTAAKLIHFALGLLALLAIFALGRRLRGPAVGMAAAALWLRALPKLNALYLFSWAFVDLGITFEMVAAVLAWVLWSRTRARGWLWGAALCAGFATSFKLTGAYVGLALGLLTLLEARRQGETAPRALRWSALFLGLSLLPVLPWFYKTWQETGNPLYPLLSGLFPTRDWNREIGRAYRTYFTYYNWDFLDVHWSLAKRQAVLAGTMLAVLVTAGLLLWRWRDREARAIVAVAALLLAFGLLTTGLNSRLILPMFSLVFLLLCMASARFLARSRVAQAALLLYLAFTGYTYLRKSAPRPVEAARMALGRTPRQAYIHAQLDLARVMDYIDAQPDVGPVLVAALEPTMGIGGSMSYYCDRYCYTTDGFYQRHFRLDTWEQFVADVRRDRIAWVILPTRTLYDRDMPDYPPARNELPFARRLAASCGTPAFAAGDFRLYRLRYPG